MALEWGSISGKMRVGLNVYIRASDSALIASAYVGNDSAGYDWTGSDNITVKINGPGSYDATINVNPTLTSSYDQEYVGQVIVPASAQNMGSTYTFTVSASGLHTGGTPSFTKSIKIPAIGNASTPTWSAVTDSDATLNWSMPANAKSVQVQVDDNSNFASRHSDYRDASTPAYPFTGPSNVSTGFIGGKGNAYGLYYARIRGYNSDYGEYGPWSSARSVRLLANVPGAPTGLNETNIGSTSAKLNWSAPSNWGGNNTGNYEVAWRPIGQSGYNYVNVNGARSYQLNGLSPNTEYIWTVRAVNARGNGAWASASSYPTFSTNANSPATPTSLSVARSSDTRHTVSWTNRATTAAPYTGVVVQRRVDGGTWTTIATTSATATSYTDTTTSANHYYDYRVYARNATGNSGYSNTDRVYTTPRAPLNVTANKTASQSVVVRWEADIPYGTYTWDIDRWTGTAWERAVDDLPAATREWEDTTPVVDFETRYRVNVTQTTDNLTSAWSESGSVQLITPPLPPTNLSPDGTVVDLSTDTTFTWSHNPLDTSPQSAYEFRFRVQGDDTWDTTGKVDSTESLRLMAGSVDLNGNVIEWQVRTWGADPNPSEWSNTATITATTPPTVAISAPVDGDTLTTSTLTVEWGYYDAEGTEQSEYRVMLRDADGALLEQKNGVGAATSVVMNTPVLDGQTYTVAVQVRDGDGMWSEVATATVDVDYLPPAWVNGTAVYDEDSGSVVLTFTPDEPVDGETVEAQFITVERSINGGPWVVIADRVPADSAIVDTQPTIHGTNCYRVTVYNDDLPTSRVQDYSVTTTNVFFNGGMLYDGGALSGVRRNYFLDPLHTKAPLSSVGVTVDTNTLATVTSEDDAQANGIPGQYVRWAVSGLPTAGPTWVSLMMRSTYPHVRLAAEYSGQTVGYTDVTVDPTSEEWVEVSLKVPDRTSTTGVLFIYVGLGDGEEAKTDTTFEWNTLTVDMAENYPGPPFSVETEPPADMENRWLWTVNNSPTDQGGQTPGNVTEGNTDVAVHISTEWGYQSVHSMKLWPNAPYATPLESYARLMVPGTTRATLAGTTITVLGVVHYEEAFSRVGIHPNSLGFRVFATNTEGATVEVEAGRGDSAVAIQRGPGTYVVRQTFAVPEGGGVTEFRVYNGTGRANGVPVWWDNLNVIRGAYAGDPFGIDEAGVSAEAVEALGCGETEDPFDYDVIMMPGQQEALRSSCYLGVAVDEDDKGFLTTGDGFAQGGYMLCGLEFTHEASRAKALHHFAGRAYPVEFSGQSLDHVIGVTGVTVGTAEDMREFEAIGQSETIVLWRDFTGERVYASIGPVSASMLEPTTPDMWTVSFTLTQVDYQG